MKILKPLLLLGFTCIILIVSCKKNNSPTGAVDQANQEEKVIDSNGGNLSSSNDSLLITIPSGAIDNEANLSVKNLSPSEIRSELGDLKAEFGTVYDISFDKDLLKEATLEFQIDESESVGGIGTSEYKIHFWSDELEGWVKPIQEFDSGQRKLTTYTNQFSIWGIFKFEPWESNQVITWSITEYPDDASQSDINSIDEILTYSFDVWEEETSRVGITFEQVSNNDDIDIPIEFGEIPGFTKYLDWIGIGGNNTTLGAVVKKQIDAVTNKQNVKIIFNADYSYWYVDEFYLTKGRTLAMHEIGHALYLDHTCDGCSTESIMTTPPNAPIAQLYPDDIEQVRKVYNIEVSEASLNTVEPSSITSNSATSGGIINNNGNSNITRKGVCWSTEENPSLDDSCTDDGTGDENFSSSLTELTGETNYYVRAYAVNEVGTAYGSQYNFTTEQEVDIPSVNTSSISSITDNSAQSGGNVTNNGGASVTARGVCWSDSQNPTTDDSCTSDGSGLGEFTSDITDLNPDTDYFVRAYATNDLGTGYGEERNFITESDPKNGDWPRDTETEIVDVTNPATGKTWMDRNLGASRAATSATDSEAYGDLYQWGRAADGHQKRNSNTSNVLSDSDQPGHVDFIIVSDHPYDWRSPQNDNLWQGVNGTNNPCPEGYRLPTEAEWEAERISWSSNNSAGAFASPLKQPDAGYRFYSSGSLRDVGSSGRYWSSTVSGAAAPYLLFYSSDAIVYAFGSNRAFGRSVRCLKD